jgi:hypothetical protein
VESNFGCLEAISSMAKQFFTMSTSILMFATLNNAGICVVIDNMQMNFNAPISVCEGR